MSLLQEYQDQFQWRPWPQILAELPDLKQQQVLDLGCAHGALSAELLKRGASVLGIDANADLLNHAEQRNLQNATFKFGYLHQLEALLADQHDAFDGIWCSFVSAYFTDFVPILNHWKCFLKPGGWIALTEIDRMFEHQPLSEMSLHYLQQNTNRALQAGRYDFNMGHKLKAYLEQAGFTIQKQLCFSDLELSFDGPAAPDVLRAWNRRLQRMAPLQALCGDEFEALQADFLNCLQSPSHRSQAKVYFYLAERVS